jgi:hypothetical protein
VRPGEQRGRANCLQSLPQPNSGSAKSPWWQYGKPKCWPFFVTWLSESLGRSSLSQSRPLLVYQSSPFFGSKSKPTVLRTPSATSSTPLPSRFMRVILAKPLPGSQMLHGAPIGT